MTYYSGMDSVADIDIFEARVPLKSPLKVGAAKISHRTYTVVRVTTTENIVGVGYCYSRGFPMGQIIEDVISPIALGSSAESPNDLRKEILALNWQSAEHGTFTAALSAVDIALNDIQAKRSDKSIASWLGSEVTKIPVYSVVGYSYGEDESGLIEEVNRALSRGVLSFKIIVGGDSPERDARRVKLLRTIVGPNAHIGVDAFRTFKTLENAIERVNRFRDHQIDFIEDPFLESEGVLSSALREATGVSISYGESLASSKMVGQILAHDECDIVRLDALVIGGVEEFLSAASLANAKGKSYSTHIHSEIHSQLAAAATNLYVGGLEYLDPYYEIDLFHHLLHSPIQVKDGSAVLSDDPGFGIEWDWDALLHYAK